jgi:hypothetical protein
MPCGTIKDICAITSEEVLMQELGIFEHTLNVRLKPIEELLEVDVRSRSNDEIAVEDHMTAVESYRQRSVRYHSLAACFLQHAKSSHFLLKKTKDISVNEQHAKEKQLIAPFEGLATLTEGAVKSIDSRVNLCKVLLRLSDERERGMR